MIYGWGGVSADPIGEDEVLELIDASYEKTIIELEMLNDLAARTYEVHTFTLPKAKASLWGRLTHQFHRHKTSFSFSRSVSKEHSKRVAQAKKERKEKEKAEMDAKPPGKDDDDASV